MQALKFVMIYDYIYRKKIDQTLLILLTLACSNETFVGVFDDGISLARSRD